MRMAVINGTRLESFDDIHLRLCNQLHFPDYYGKNLDALYDLLSTEDRNTLVLLFDSKGMVERLGNKGKKLVETFQDAALINQRIRFIRIEKTGNMG